MDSSAITLAPSAAGLGFNESSDGPANLIARIESERSISLASHQVAIRRPLADLVDATITAAANSPHTERTYRRAIGAFVEHLAAAYASLFDAPLVTRFVTGPRRAVGFDYGDTPPPFCCWWMPRCLMPIAAKPRSIHTTPPAPSSPWPTATMY